jgi:hypothetical protein
MDWLAVANAADVYRFGWLMGVATGLYALVVIDILILTAPAYHPDVPLAVRKVVRHSMQWILLLAQLLLFGAWVGGGVHVGYAFLTCYVITLCFGAMSVVIPILLLFMLTSAGHVGAASAR